MRNRRKTIESLRRLAERPGTVAEGETAQRLLDRMRGSVSISTRFDAGKFPRFTPIYYNYWAYPPNAPGTVVGRAPKEVQGRMWLRIKFAYLKNPRAVPVTSAHGCHISTAPLRPDEAEYLAKDAWLEPTP